MASHAIIRRKKQCKYAHPKEQMLIIYSDL